jgi:hypothetical protein
LLGEWECTGCGKVQPQATENKEWIIRYSGRRGGGASKNSCKEWNLVIKAFREKIFLMKV